MQRLMDHLEWRLGRLLQRLYIYRLRGKVSLGPGASVVRGTKVAAAVSIGAGTQVNRGCVLRGAGKISIGKYCALGEGIHILSGTSNHGINRANLQAALQRRFGPGSLGAIEKDGRVRIGHNVWIGDNAIVLGGVTIGDGAVIGAASVVTRDVPAFTIVAGSPARPIRRRFDDEIIEELEAIAWWDWAEDRLDASRDLFAADLTQPDAISLLRRFR